MDKEDLEFVPEEGENLKVADPVKKISDLKDKLKNCEKEKQDYLNNWQRERADFQNFKKDEEKRVIDRANFLKEKFLTDFLAVVDSFDMAMQNKEAWEKVDKNWRVGVEYIYGQFLTALEKNGVSQIGEINVGFDPNVHQSVEMIATDKKENDHKISEIVQKGYKMGEKVIRPARVKVFEYNK